MPRAAHAGLPRGAARRTRAVTRNTGILHFILKNKSNNTQSSVEQLAAVACGRADYLCSGKRFDRALASLRV